MKKIHIGVLALALVIFCTHYSYSQSGISKETKILEQQLNLFSAANEKQAGKEKFEFDGCSCKYINVNDESKDSFSMSKTSSFDLKEVSSVSYAKNDNNTYELRVKLKTEDNALTQMFDLSSINVNLYTSDEKQVKAIANRFKDAVKSCNSK